jgi:hypothetical protein
LSKAFDVSLVNSEVTLQDTSKASPQASIPASSPMKTREYNQTLPNLSSWPIKLELVSPAAPFFDRAILVLAADCAMAAALDFRERFLGLDKSLIIGCPKLGDWSLYEIKLTTILQKHPKIAELWLPIMSVHCCQGFWHLAKKVLAQSNRLDVALKGWIFSPDGELEAESLTLEAGVGY